MDRALVKHAKNDIDGDQGSKNENRCAAQRALEGLCITLEACRDRRRQMEVSNAFPYRRHGFAYRTDWSEIKAQRDGRKLALMVYCDRRNRRSDASKLIEWHHSAAR